MNAGYAHRPRVCAPCNSHRTDLTHRTDRARACARAEQATEVIFLLGELRARIREYYYLASCAAASRWHFASARSLSAADGDDIPNASIESAILRRSLARARSCASVGTAGPAAFLLPNAAALRPVEADAVFTRAVEAATAVATTAAVAAGGGGAAALPLLAAQWPQNQSPLGTELSEGEQQRKWRAPSSQPSQRTICVKPQGPH